MLTRRLLESSPDVGTAVSASVSDTCDFHAGRHGTTETRAKVRGDENSHLFNTLCSPSLPGV